jgi:RNA recognition motif-containing protein
MSVRLFVGNLPYDATEKELRELFSAVGPLSQVFLPIDRGSGKPRGFAFVEFNDPGQAQEAIRRFNNQMFKGRPITIKEAHARDERPRTSTPPRQSYATPAVPDVDATPPTTRGARSGHFGPDALPRRNRSKVKKTPKSERVPKGPMREVVHGRFFGGDDDDLNDDDLGENYASRESDWETERDD